MRVLALETVGTTGSVAVLDDSVLLAQQVLDPTQRSAQSLAPGIEAICRHVDWSPADVQLVAVAVGPGSFTGLRIGVTTAKAFAYAVGAELTGVHTLEAIASCAPLTVASVSVIMDAGRGELYVGGYRRLATGELVEAQPTGIVSSANWLSNLKHGETVAGPALDKILGSLPQGVTALDRAVWHPTAAAIGTLGWRHWTAGRRDNVFELVPQYYRRTAAEEQWEKRQD